MAGKGALNFGKSKARMMARDKNKITFKDVAGVDEAKDEVQELVEFLQGPEEVPEARRTHPQGRADDRLARHGQDAARPGHRGRGGRAVLLDQRLGLRGNVRRRGREPRARHVRAGPQERAVPDLHRRNRRRGPASRPRRRRRPRRARTDAQRPARGDGRLRHAGRHHHHRRDQPPRRARSRAAASRAVSTGR